MAWYKNALYFVLSLRDELAHIHDENDAIDASTHRTIMQAQPLLLDDTPDTRFVIEADVDNSLFKKSA